MIQIMYVELKPAITDGLNILPSNCVALFRDNLEGGLKPIRFIQVHQLRSEVSAGCCLYIVRHDQAIWCAFRQKPDKGNLLYSVDLHRKPQKFLVQRVDREIDGPCRKR